jgi:hypothetical protein
MPRSLLLLLALALIGCPTGDDDDDITDDDDDATGADDDDATGDDDDDATGDDDDMTPCLVTLSGSVIGIDRESGAILSAEEYEARAGGLILYTLPNAANLAVIHDKVTMTGPGAWSMTLFGCQTDVDVAAVVDIDRDFIIGSNDVLREHPFNPVLLPANGIVEDIDVYVDLPRIEDDSMGDDDDDDASGPGDDDDDASGPGDDDDDASGPGDDDDDASGPGDDDDDLKGPDDDDDDSTLLQCPSNFTGDVLVTGYPQAPIVVTANEQDMTEGPWASTWMAAPGEYEIVVDCLADLTSFIAILDADENLFFEPSDPSGESANNPWNLGFANTAGVHIEIPTLITYPPPSPAPYEGISGTVLFPDFLTGDILVFATAVHPGGNVYSQATLAAPGPFSLIAPPGATDILVWGVLDEDGDGQYDVYVDPFDSYGPFDLDGAETGIVLDLTPDPPEPGTISGLVFWPDDDADGSDCLRTGIFDQEPMATTANPYTPISPQFGANFPAPFEFNEIPTGTWWVASYLDRACDNDFGPGPEDPEGQVAYPVQLAPAGLVDDVEVWMEM